MSNRVSGEQMSADWHRITRAALASCIHDAITELSNKHLAVLVVHFARPKHYDPVSRIQAWELTLQQIDERIGKRLRDADRYARMSDEKLCVVLTGLTSDAQAVLAAVRILSALQEPFDQEVKNIPARPCVGIALYPAHARNADDLVACADVAAGIAVKSDDGYHLFRPEDRSDVGNSYGEIESQLINAIRLNELPVNYQPQIDIVSGRCLGAEALLRWKASGTAHIPPATIVAMAERAGFIAALTFGVLNTVLRQAAEFLRQDLDVNLSVNISTSMLADLEMPEMVQQSIETWNVPADRLTLEITETVMMDNVERSVRLLARLRRIGVRLSMDDFGTGYSSLAYLQRLPLHELKIDRTFVASMLASSGDRQIVRSIIDLSHNFSLQAVAEGVEDRASFEALKAMGCDVAQGYLFSPALSYPEFVNWLKNWSG